MNIGMIRNIEVDLDEFEKEVLEKINNNKPLSKFDIEVLVSEFDIVDNLDDNEESLGKDNRFIIKIADKHIMIYYNQVLTELDDNKYKSQTVVEVISTPTMAEKWTIKSSNKEDENTPTHTDKSLVIEEDDVYFTWHLKR